MDEFFEFQPGEKCLGFFYLGYTDDKMEEGVRQSWADKIMWYE
jgi:hypothetical protein